MHNRRKIIWCKKLIEHKTDYQDTASATRKTKKTKERKIKKGEGWKDEEERH